MSPENPLRQLSDDELVARHSLQAADNHFLSELIRRLKLTLESHKTTSEDLGNKIWWLNLWLLVFTIAIAVLTGVLVWTNL